MRRSTLGGIAIFVVCLVMAAVLTLVAYRFVAHPKQQAEDVPDVVEVFDLGLSDDADQAEPSDTDDEGAPALATISDGDGAATGATQSSAGITIADDGERVFTMPEGVSYEEGVAILQVGEGTTAEEVAQLLEQTPGVVPREVSDEEVASGIIEVGLAEGASVEDVVNELLASPVAEGAQPNFEYVVMVGDESDLRDLVSEALDIEPLPEEPDHEPQPKEEPSDAEDGDLAADEEMATGDEVAEGDMPPVEERAGEVPGAPDQDAPQQEGAPEDEASAEGAHEAGEVTPDESGDDATLDDAEAGEPADEEHAPEEAQPSEPDAEGEHPEAKDAEDDVVAEEQTPEEPLGGEGASELLAAVSVNDPLLKGQTSTPASDWALTSVRAYQAWGLVKCSQKVTVAVLDTGFQADHEDLKANVRVTYDAVTGSSDVSPIGGLNYSHGTHVAGIVAAKANNGVGVAGMSYDAGLMLVKVASSTGRLTTTNLVRAYDYVMANASAHNVRVVNVSMGINTTKVDTALNGRINQAYEQGIVTVAASGNSDINGGVVPYAEYPGDEGNVVSVINLQSEGNSVSRYSTSNYNLPGMRNKNVSAPGTSILSTVPTNDYTTLTGTSMAAPFVSGILALEFAAKPSLTASEAVSCLYASATDLGPKGFDEGFGWGEVDAYAAVYLAKNGKVPDGTTDDSQAAADAVAAAEVQARIEALPEAAEVTRAHAPAIRTARAAYNALTSAQKKLVDVSRLVAAEKALSSKAATVTRLYGQNAYDTMRAITQSSSGFASGRGGTVIVATGEGYWDALAASSLAGVLDAPVLITQKSYLPSQTKSEVARLKPTQILVMGGSLAITDDVMSQLEAASGVKPRRVYGQTAPDTAVEIYKQGKGSWGKTAIVATANGYWDALSVAPYAYAKNAPIFLTTYSSSSEGRTLSSSALSALKAGGFTRVLVIGGKVAIPSSVETQLKGIGITTVRRIWGQTAIDTSIAVAQFCLGEGMVANGMGVATSNGYWDALTGAALCGRNDAVLVLAASETSPSITTFVRANRLDIAQLYVFGGTLAVSQASEAAIKAALK